MPCIPIQPSRSVSSALVFETVWRKGDRGHHSIESEVKLLAGALEKNVAISLSDTQKLKIKTMAKGE